MTEDWKLLKRLIETRRSVRVFLNDPVPSDLVRDCLETSLLAPSSSNLQPWEFYWIRDSQLKEQVDKICLSQVAAKSAPELVVAVARTATWKANNEKVVELMEKTCSPPSRLLRYHKERVPRLYRLGPLNFFGGVRRVLISLTGLFLPVPRFPFSKSQLRVWAVKSTALACQNFMMALHSAGLSSCPMEGFDEKRMKKILDLPRDAIVVMCIAVGYGGPLGVTNGRVRIPASEFIKEL